MGVTRWLNFVCTWMDISGQSRTTDPVGVVSCTATIPYSPSFADGSTNSTSAPFNPPRISVLNHESDRWSVSAIVIFSIAATAFPSCDGWSAVSHWIKNGSSRESVISLTPIYFHFRSLPSGRVRWPSIALRPNFSSTFEISSVAKTQVSQPPPSCALCPGLS